ncbi:uncharacterized protein KY384_005660 [Bacidia gigantensis]|uniref:uncharacterized protein n=1 Tax=Bacidia gigantensis TaxID=2732470 RepID=UPI001D050F0A|nr:uncharacterized protein KY384_005660 [Bacidia gigantensis]KAG8530177.1 hypothetical protein KY384_005660 [Bacidia gigantensis]
MSRQVGVPYQSRPQSRAGQPYLQNGDIHDRLMYHAQSPRPTNAPQIQKFEDPYAVGYGTPRRGEMSATSYRNSPSHSLDQAPHGVNAQSAADREMAPPPTPMQVQRMLPTPPPRWKEQIPPPPSPQQMDERLPPSTPQRMEEEMPTPLVSQEGASAEISDTPEAPPSCQKRIIEATKYEPEGTCCPLHAQMIDLSMKVRLNYPDAEEREVTVDSGNEATSIKRSFLRSVMPEVSIRKNRHAIAMLNATKGGNHVVNKYADFRIFIDGEDQDGPLTLSVPIRVSVDSKQQCDLLLGNNLFHPQGATFDYAGGLIYFRANGSFKAPLLVRPFIHEHDEDTADEAIEMEESSTESEDGSEDVQDVAMGDDDDSE